MVGYSIAYPASILGVILAMYLAERHFRIDYKAEARSLKDVPGVSPDITCWTLRVDRPEAVERTVRELVAEHRLHVVFGRIRRGEHTEVVNWESYLEEGDLVTAVGTEEELERAAAQVLGRRQRGAGRPGPVRGGHAGGLRLQPRGRRAAPSGS